MSTTRSRRLRRAVAAFVVLGSLTWLAQPTGAGAAEPPPETNIVGGTLAATGEFPFQAIVSPNGGLCGGSLLTPQWILTAAHCVDGGVTPSQVQVVVGRTKRSNTSQGVSRSVSEIRLHPSWNPTTRENDVALLRMSVPVTTIAPIRLVEPTERSLWQPGDTATVIGYGRTCESGCATSDDLRKVDVPIQSDSTMQSASVYGTAFKPASMLGAGPLGGGKDSCQGDSGGPLFVRNGAGLSGIRQVGIVSWGIGCARVNKPGVYSRVGEGAVRAFIDSVAPRQLHGYVWANNPTTPSYIPHTSYQYNSSGALNDIVRLGTGQYQVRFPNLGVSAGMVQVTGYGSGTHRCKSAGWGPSGSVLVASVRCFSTAGALVDSLFTASFTRNVPGIATGRGAYVWANSPTSASYTPATPWQFNATGALNTITRTGTGQYRVNIPNLGVSAGHVVVTAYGSTSEYCNVTSWFPSGSTQQVFVQCRNNVGALVDTFFNMTYVERTNIHNRSAKHGYVWANNPTAASYTPSATYSFNSSGATNTITRQGTGAYTVFLPNLGASVGHVQVTAYNTANRCKVFSWVPTGSTQRIFVQCHTPGGTPADTLFTADYMI